MDTTPPDPDPAATTRERFRQHSADARCASCHRLLDNVGFGLEEFAHLGRFRAEENGLPIDATGRRFSRLMPNATYVEIEGAPHGMIVTHATAVNETLLPFLQK